MTTAIINASSHEEINRMTDGELLNHISQLMRDLRGTVAALATPIDIATRRGISLSKFGLTHNNINAFQLIAQGQIDERLGAKYGTNPVISLFSEFRSDFPLYS